MVSGLKDGVNCEHQGGLGWNEPPVASASVTVPSPGLYDSSEESLAFVTTYVAHSRNPSRNM